jgi:hypothetical protein
MEKHTGLVFFHASAFYFYLLMFSDWDRKFFGGSFFFSNSA